MVGTTGRTLKQLLWVGGKCVQCTLWGERRPSREGGASRSVGGRTAGG